MYTEIKLVREVKKREGEKERKRDEGEQVFGLE